MKKTYISPIVRPICLEDTAILATSNLRISEEQKSEGWSNERSASSYIWDE